MQAKIRSLHAVILLLIIAIPLPAFPPSWVQSYGIHTSYPQSTHLSGFARITLNEDSAQARVRDLALDDLSRKIRTQVHSELVQYNRETGDIASSSVFQITRNSVQVTVLGANIEYYEDERFLYALASVVKTTLVSNYAAEASGIWASIKNTQKKARREISAERIDLAIRSLYRAYGLFPNLYELFTLARAVQNNSGNFFQSLVDAESLSDLQNTETEIDSRIDELTDRKAETLDEAIRMTAVMLGIQGLHGGDIQIPPMLYESTSFSSEFGRYAAERLESELSGILSPGSGKTIFQGQYWEEGENLRLIVLVSNLKGEKIGKSEVLMPLTSVGRHSLKPQGFSEAMTALREFTDGAMSDGTINIDIWTNKGRDSDALVFLKGEVVRLFFRVNQPAYLQITYRLSSGDIVLLEEAFYLGSDRVNRTVSFPVEFDVVPPYGIENLIVTAYSNVPPPSGTVPKKIDGELYQVFDSVKAVVKNVRGLARRHDSAKKQERVGEAMLTLTTLPR